MKKELNPQDIPEDEKKEVPDKENVVMGNPNLNKVPRGQIMKQQQAERKAAKALLFEDSPKKAVKKPTKK